MDMNTKFRFKTHNGYIEYKDRAEGESKHPDVIPEIIEEEVERVVPAQRKSRQKTIIGDLDFNDINARLNNLYAILETRFNYNIEDSLNIEQKACDSKIEMKVSFGEDADGAEVWNKITTIINQLAHLKDPLKNFFKEKGLQSELVETEINSYPCLQIVIDISNSWKHGYPLTKSERSKKSPRIKNIEHAVSVSATEAGTGSYFGINLQTGQPIMQGDVSIVIEADIVDGTGNYLCSLGQLINECTGAWQKITKNIT